MKIKFLFIFILLNSIVFAQNEKSVIVEGTKCRIIPPKKFTASAIFSGFEKADAAASIMIVEMPTSYAQMVINFTPDVIKNQGMILVKTENLQIQNYNATLYYVTQLLNNTNFNKQILMFGDSSFTELITGIYPASQKKLRRPIHKSMLSITYHKEQIVNGEFAAKFKVDISSSNFKYTSYLSGSLIYTLDGLMPTQTENKEVFIVGSGKQEVNIATREQYSIARLKALPYGETTEVEEIHPITLNNMEGYEVVAHGLNSQKKKQMYYEIILYAQDDLFYIMLGTTLGNFESDLNTFKTMAKTFQLK